MQNYVGLNQWRGVFSLEAFPFWKSEKPASQIPTTTRRKRSKAFYFENQSSTLQERLLELGLWSEAKPLRLHLGCGQVGFEEYVNIDYPPDRHQVMHQTEADLYADINHLRVLANEVDEIRLHHVFEHFSRVDALIMLIKWSTWLKKNGLLIIEVPDFEANARQFLQSKDYRTKSGIVRHLVGDQSSEWGYHIEQWWPQRLRQTLFSLGFKVEAIEKYAWPNPPFLSNCTIFARAQKDMDDSGKILAAKRLLVDSMISPLEEDTFLKWQEKLNALEV
ncbi:class I SAM-dependent methyltransferase [Cyanobium gracile]|uniref:Methyltransferase family protein n=1 Tax=Cyanobium gracile (strain ATCC 27147 / PCC 6307) TaxID=292564 RepID=K9P9Y7_CYAGP|nr:hypothetical protein [Cyanobium gracile]AFY29374.1 hypothetical protein Cyagr_2263 [Cyanobium gracile PCC 6307]